MNIVIEINERLIPIDKEEAIKIYNQLVSALDKEKERDRVKKVDEVYQIIKDKR